MYLIAGWGSSGSGKTTISLALAAAFAKKGKDVLVLSTDSRTPSLPVFLPGVKGLTSKNSVAELLTMTGVTEGQLKDRISRHPKSNHIFFMGVASGEISTLTYGPPKRESVMALLQLLRKTSFDYVIIDCDSNPVLDATTLIALEWADYGFCSLTPDIKGYEYLKSQLAWLGNRETFRVEKYTRILNFIEPATPVSEVQLLIKDIRFLLPTADRVREKMVAGEPLADFHQGTNIEFERQIRLLAEDIEEVKTHGRK